VPAVAISSTSMPRAGSGSSSLRNALSTLGKVGRGDLDHERAQVGHRRAQRVGRLEQLRIGLARAARGQREREPRERLHHAIVEVTGDALALGVTGVDRLLQQGLALLGVFLPLSLLRFDAAGEQHQEALE